MDKSPKLYEGNRYIFLAVCQQGTTKKDAKVVINASYLTRKEKPWKEHYWMANEKYVLVVCHGVF